MKPSTYLRAIALATLIGLRVPAEPQQVGGLGAASRAKAYVTYTAEPQVVTAGKRSILELHFRVAEGFHVNSHTPKSELLIPTQLVLGSTEGIKSSAPEYPAGTSYSFSFDPSEKLDVYSGVFTLKVPVTAAPGEHAMDATLKYQACDHAACYPPKSLPIQIAFTAR